MIFYKWVAGVFLFAAVSAKAQFNYTNENLVVVENSDSLTQAFSGGFVAPQFSAIDLNSDGIDDLFGFDRISNNISTFVYIENQYVYAPQYEMAFPSGLKNWVLLRDYNCDGRVDIFTSSIFGMSLFENTSASGILSWELIHQTIYTEGSSGQTNLQVAGADLPAIADVDQDGDLDILNFNFAVGGGIEYHQNKSMENSGTCGLELERITKRYGEFDECTCETYVFGTDECPDTGGRLAHAGGKSILSFDGSGNGVHDLLIGQEYCDLPGFITNSGSNTSPQMTSVRFDFPDAAKLLKMEFPAFFEFDVDHDGTNDLLAVPNRTVTDGTQDYTSLATYYKGQGNGQFTYQSDKFFKDEMIDVGFRASPAFSDLDFDGDEDMLVGTGINGAGATVWYYENTGSASNPAFELITSDYLGLGTNENESIKLQMLDIDGNADEDLVLFKTKNGTQSVIAYLHSGSQANPFSVANTIDLSLPINSVWDMPFLFQLGSNFGLLVGKQGGNLQYYTSSAGLASGNWQLVSDSYLGLAEDFTKRNLRVVVDDLDSNGTLDLITCDDSNSVKVYDNFLAENSPQLMKGIVPETTESFDLLLGSQANPTTASLFGTKELTVAFGLLQGGIVLYKNTNQTKGNNELMLKVSVYPNPTGKGQVSMQANKQVSVRILSPIGKQVVNPFTIESGKEVTVTLGLSSGIYILEATSTNGDKKLTRIMISN